MSIVYYISSHGLGHAVRSAAILSRIPEDIPLIVRTEVSHELLAEEISREYHYEPASFDVGAVQVDGFTVDGPQTLSQYDDIHRANGRRKNAEMEFLNKHRARVVVSDIASFPLAVAHDAQLRSIAIGNFTWADIYEPFVAERPSYRSLLDEIRQEYAMADVGLRLPLSLPMSGLEQVADISLVCRRGNSIRPALAGWLDVDPDARWALVYVGQYPVDFDFDRLAEYAGWQFFQFSREKSKSKGIVSIDPRRFDVADVFASCSVVIGKVGYGTVADCIAADVPIVYALPNGFAEGEAMDDAISEWGRGVKVDRETLFRGDLSPAIDAALATRSKKEFDLRGAEVAAEFLTQEWRSFDR